ncbi:MAG TPA: nucleoside recognition domain-containing protein [Clostridia bacterium]|nr:nucleoside recognition domain-containing protein [Clostridia bacterium]
MSFIVPMIILLVLLYGYMKGVKVYDAFIEGARDGLLITVKILPYIAAMLLAVGMLRSSGGLDFMLYALKPLTSAAGIPEEVMPLIIMKPLSGSGALGILADILKNNGADSPAGVLASIIMSSTETIFYTITVYFGSIGIRNIRHTLAAAVIADVAGVTAAVLICRFLLFKG